MLVCNSLHTSASLQRACSRRCCCQSAAGPLYQQSRHRISSAQAQYGISCAASKHGDPAAAALSSGVALQRRGACSGARSSTGRPRRAAAAGAALRENPQNVPEVEVVPAPELTARQAVEAQLQAIQQNDVPWVNHGIHLMYEFCYDAGSMERSRMFGFSKDLYHVDHFMGAIGNFCPELINCSSFKIGPERQLPGGGAGFQVQVTAVNGGGATFDFVLLRQEWGLRKGSWQTKSLTRSEAQA